MDSKDRPEEGALLSPRLPSGALNQDEEDYWLRKTRSGGAYIPPARLAMMARTFSNRSSEAYQRVSWEALKKSINGLVNKANTANIKPVVLELLGENLIRGRGLLVRSVMRAQSAALPFTAVYAALIAVVNTKLPQIGELLLTRLIVAFRRAYRRNDKPQCLAQTMFLAHLVNQRVAHEIVVLQIITLLLERPTDDSVEIAVGLMRECGAFLAEMSPKPTNAVFERFRAILHEGSIDKRVQYMIEVLFQVRKDRFRNNLSIPVDLDLVDEDDQITHYVSLDDELDVQDEVNVFRVDEQFEESEAKYEEIRREILGDGQADAQEDDAGQEALVQDQQQQGIADMTGTNLVNLRKTIYLTIMSSVDFEECGHKLLKMSLPEGCESELCNMIVECASQERTYMKFYGLLAERFCKLNMIWRECFERCFVDVYTTVHRLETNRIRNVAKLFAHLLETEATPWTVFASVRLTEDDTTAAGRIFLKIVFQDLAEFHGVAKLQTLLASEPVAGSVTGLFCRDSARNLRFSINFFTAIGLPQLTDDLRTYLSIMPTGPVGNAGQHADRRIHHERALVSSDEE